VAIGLIAVTKYEVALTRAVASDPIDAVALRCRRFWFPRGSPADLSDGGFLRDSESAKSWYTRSPAASFEELAATPVLVLLGEPGMGKSTALNKEVQRVESAASRLLRVDLAGIGTDVLVCETVFQSEEISSWRHSNARLNLFLDGLDTCLQHVKTLVALLRERFEKLPRDRLTLRIACRTADWPPDLEIALGALWPAEGDIGICELAPLRKHDVRVAAESTGIPADEFLSEVSRLGAAPFASRPITLKFMLNTFGRKRQFPSQRPGLYRQGCLALCDEWRHDRRRSRKFSEGSRFSMASRLAAVSVFSGRVAICTGAHQDIMHDGDVRNDELLGGSERFER